MQQEQNQVYMQTEYLIMMSLNGWLNSLVELDKYSNLPFSCEFAKYVKGKMLDDINYSITQTLAPVLQIKEENKANSHFCKKEFIPIILEYQSLRIKKGFDIIDELCSIVISNAIGIPKEVPQRIINQRIELKPESLNEYINKISKTQYEIEKGIIKLLDTDGVVEFKMIASANKDLNKGLARYKDVAPSFYNDIFSFLNT